MMRFILLFLSSLVTGVLLAGRTPGFSMTAFNMAVPASDRNAVFSPYGFELDAVIISEAFGPIEKAKFVETLGALVGYENVFRPLAQRYLAARTNDFVLISARAYLASSLRLISPKYRSYIQSEYGAQACPARPGHEGAVSYFKAAMDGEMEDFAIPSALADVPKGVSFVDLESFHCHWLEPFPTANTRRIAFTSENGFVSEVPAMADVRSAEIWETDRFTMLRLPMTDGAYFHAVLPANSNNLASIRGEFAAEKLDTALVVIRSITEKGIYRGNVAVVLPKIEIDSLVDLSPAFFAAGLPTAGFKDIFIGGKPLAGLVQRTRFVLDEKGPDGISVPRKSSESEVRVDQSRRFICNRPFLFFVCHEPTRTIPVSGIFAGGRQ